MKTNFQNLKQTIRIVLMALTLTPVFSTVADAKLLAETQRGGIVVIAQGLVDSNVSVGFPSSNYRIGTVEVTMVIKDMNNAVLYTTNSNSTTVQIPNLNLTTGAYLLEVSLNGAVNGVVFYVD